MSDLEIAGLRKSFGATPVLRGLDLRIETGALAAVLGPSGCGKTTLLRLIAGFETVDAGSIRVGDDDLLTADPGSWQRQVAWLPQRPWLVAGTVADNVRVGRPDATDADVWAALEQVGLGELVATSPDGIDTQLAEDASDWSAGQRARLVLARVVLADRPFVLLDEPTAHLDDETEAVLLDTLRRLARRSTVVVVAHRDAVVAAAAGASARISSAVWATLMRRRASAAPPGRPRRRPAP